MNDKAMAKFLRWNGYLYYEAARAAACVSECLPHALVTRAGEGVGEGRVEEGGGVRGCEVLYGRFPSGAGTQSF